MEVCEDESKLELSDLWVLDLSYIERSLFPSSIYPTPSKKIKEHASEKRKGKP